VIDIPKSQAQQAIEAVRRLVAHGQLSEADGTKVIINIRRKHEVKAYRAVLESAAHHQPQPGVKLDARHEEDQGS